MACRVTLKSAQSFRRHYSKADALVRIQKILRPFVAIAEHKHGDSSNGDRDRDPKEEMLVAVKDNICIASHNLSTTCSSLILKDYKAPYTAPCLRALLAPGSGFRLLGKTNLDEFAMGSYTLHSAFGPTWHASALAEPDGQNPRVAGGSSGGSAVAVAADLVQVAIGTDTGGSVRLPASYNNIIGFKPTYGRISRDGLVCYAHSLDTVGLFVKKDLHLMQNVFAMMSRETGNDMTHWQRKEQHQGLGPRRSLNIGVISELVVEEIPKATLASFQHLLDYLVGRGHTLVSVSLPSIKYALPAYYVLASVECASNLARFDGLRFGHSRLSEHTGFGLEVRRRILLGTFLSRFDHTLYETANLFRAQLQKEFQDHFAHCDVLVSLTSATPAPRRADTKSDSNPLVECTSDLMTIPANIARIPALSMPMRPGVESHEALGVQWMGPSGKDEEFLQMCEWLQADIQARLHDGPRT